MHNAKLQKFTRTALLVAVMLVLAFTPLSSIKIGVIEMTPMVIPIAIGTITLGPVVGLILGFVFGLTSFLQCVGFPVLSGFGAALFEINPLYTVILCLVPRMLMGLLPGLIFKATMKNGKPSFWKFTLAGILTPLFNTIFFIAAFILFFSGTEFFAGLQEMFGTGLIAFVSGFVGINGLIEILATFVIATPIAVALYHYQNRPASI